MDTRAHVLLEDDGRRVGHRHQLEHPIRATDGEPLGFLCMVNAMRDRPQLPTEQELAALKANPAVAGFLTDQS